MICVVSPWWHVGGHPQWLEADLKAVNRTLTPWLFVSFHQPFYHTWSTGHYKEVCDIYAVPADVSAGAVERR